MVSSLVLSLILISPLIVTQDIKIGLLYTDENKQAQIAFNQAIQEINDNDKILPENRIESVAVSIGTSSDNPAFSTNKMCKMLSENDITAIIGPYISSQVKACSYLAGEMGLPIISPAATDPYLNNPLWSPTLARLNPTNKVQAKVLVNLLEHYDWRRISIVYTTEDYGVTLREAVKEELHRREMTMVAEVAIQYGMVVELIDESMKRAWITELLNANSRITLLLLQPSYADMILEAAYTYGMVGSDFAWIASTAVTGYLNMFDTEGGEGAIKTYYDGLIGLTPYLDVTGGFYKRLEAVYKEAGYPIVSAIDALVYDAVYLVLNSLDSVYRKNDDEIIFENYKGKCYEDVPDSQNWKLGQKMYNEMVWSKYTGITGHRQMWPTGDPDEQTHRYNVVNFRAFGVNNITTIGIFEPGEDGTFTSSWTEPATWFNKQTKVPTDNPLLHGATLRLGVLEDAPFIIYNYTKQGYPNCSAMPNIDHCYTGVSIDIIKKLADKLGFAYEYIESPDGHFGDQVNGVWNGLIREVNEQRIDVGIVGFGTSHTREKAVNFGISFYHGGVRMAVSKDVASADYFFFLRPFSTNVWVSIVLGIGFFFGLIFLFDRFSPYGNYGGAVYKMMQCSCPKCLKTLKRGIRDIVCPYEDEIELRQQMRIMSAPNALWLSVCSFLTVAPADGIPKNWSGRLTITIWWLVCLVIVSMYTANLAAFLTVSRMGVDITNVDELLAQKEFIFGTVESSITENLLRYSDNEKLNKVYFRSNSTKTYDEAVMNIKLGKYIFLYGVGPLDYTTSVHCSIGLVGDVLVDFGYAFAFPQRSPYIEIFNREMLDMQEKAIIKDFWHYYVKGQCSDDETFDAEADTLGVSSLIGLLYVCLPMLTIAIIVFGCEIWQVKRRDKGRSRQPSITGLMKMQLDHSMSEESVQKLEGNSLTPTEHSSLHVTMDYSNMDAEGDYEIPNKPEKDKDSSLAYISPDEVSFHPQDTSWCLESAASKPLTSLSADMQAHVAIITDASITGWGATNLYSRKNVHGYWKEEERALPQHILEIKAVYMALKIYCRHQDNVHMQVNLDNKFAVDIINGSKGHESKPVTFIRRKIWELVLSHNITLSAQFLDGSRSITANIQSRLPVDSTDWSLPQHVYSRLIKHFDVTPDVDMFASMHTTKCDVFISRSDDPKSAGINAFRQNWNIWNTIYAFPPLNDKVIAKTIKRISSTKSKVLLVVPWWSGRKWFSHLKTLVTEEPLSLGRKLILKHPHDQRLTHPIQERLKLGVVLIDRGGGKSEVGTLPEDITMSEDSSKEISEIPSSHIAPDPSTGTEVGQTPGVQTGQSPGIQGDDPEDIDNDVSAAYLPVATQKRK